MMTEENLFRSDKVVKRGMGGKESPRPSGGGTSPENRTSHQNLPSLSFSSSSLHESKGAQVNHTRLIRSLESWMPRGYILATICLLSLVAVTASFMFARSLGQPGINDEDSGLSSLPSRLRLTDKLLLSSSFEEENRKSDVCNSSPLKSSTVKGMSCDPKHAKLKVYMYDLPLEYHFGMTDMPLAPENPRLIWPTNLSDLPRYPGGLYQQHSPEFWITADLLTSNSPDRRNECTAVRVINADEADVFFVPFFASLSYNRYSKEKKGGSDRNEELQLQLVQFLTEQKMWQKSAGRDHIIVIHHPNSMHVVREQLSMAMFIVSDFGRYSAAVANIEKDIVAPYKHVITTFRPDVSSFQSRTLLLFFQGAIVRKEGGVIRQQLFDLLKGEDGVHFATGNTQSNGIRSAMAGMRSAKFCLHLAGDTPSSNRLFDAIASHCVPVIISDDIELPYEDAIDYSKFCIFVRSKDALQSDFVISLLRSISENEWTGMWEILKEVDHYFEYQHPTEPNDAVNMVWEVIARKVPSLKFRYNKGKRYDRSNSFASADSVI